MTRAIRSGDYFLLPYDGQPHELLVRAVTLNAWGLWSVSYPQQHGRTSGHVSLDACERITPSAARAILKKAPVLSPLGLVQERVPRDMHYPWRVIVCCALLNRTQGAQVRPMLVALFRDAWPSPESAFRVSPREIIEPLGLYNRREALLRRLTWDYLAGRQPHECFGVGEYGSDAVALFAHGSRLDADRVADRWLKPYAEWRRTRGSRALNWDRTGHDRWRAENGLPPLQKPPSAEGVAKGGELFI